MTHRLSFVAALGLRLCVAWLVIVVDNAWAQEPVEALGDPAGAPLGDRAWFQNTSLEQRQEARALFLEGNRLMRVPAFLEAARAYRKAIAVWDHPAIYFNLAIAQINLAKPTDAYASLQEGTRHGAGPLGNERHERALAYMETLRKRLSRVRVVCEQRDVQVSLDGKVLFTGPGSRETIAQAGAHQLVASKEGYLTESRFVVSPAGERTEVTLRLRKPGEMVPVRRWPVWKPWAVIGGGAVAMLGAGLLDWRSSEGFADYDEQFFQLCREGGCVKQMLPADLRSQLSGARAQQWVARVGYGMAGGALVAGAVLLYVNRERYAKAPVEDEGAARASLGPVVAPMLTGQIVGLQAGLKF